MNYLLHVTRDMLFYTSPNWCPKELISKYIVGKFLSDSSPMKIFENNFYRCIPTFWYYVDYAPCVFRYCLMEGFTALISTHTYPYNLQCNHWRSRSNNSDFPHHTQILQEMDQLFVNHNFPITPFTPVGLLPQRRRAPIDDLQLYSPPRRERPCYQQCDDVIIDQTVNISF